MKQMAFSWPFWSFWIVTIIILVIMCSVAFFVVSPHLMRFWPARSKLVPYISWGSALFVGSLLSLIIYLLLPVGYACEGLTPSGTFTCQTGKITIGGSTALDPFVQDAIGRYEKVCKKAIINDLDEAKGAAKIQGSLAGLRALAGGNVDIGTSDVFMSSYKSFDAGEYQDYQVAVVKYVVIVHKPTSNQQMPSSLSISSLQQIYSNEDAKRTWGVYGGPQDEKIVPFARDQYSGTEVTFEQYVIKTSAVTVDNDHQVPNPQDVIDYVEGTQGAIGYVSSYDWIRYGDANKALVLNINGSSSNSSDVENSQYPFWNIEHIYIKKGNVNPLVQSFIAFLGVKDVMSDLGNFDYIPLTNIGKNVLETRCSS